jgi:hypothetical protein
MGKASKIQHLLIDHLLEKGQISLLLPGGMSVEVGIVQEGKHGLQKTDDYCWVTANQNNNSVNIDSYNNLYLQYPEKSGKMLIEDKFEKEGMPITVLQAC